MTIKNRKSFICGIKSTKLTKNEFFFIKKNKPWGIILFQRNIKDIVQTKKLTNTIKKLYKDPNYPILIDEEGGRVSRLKNIVDNSIFSGKYFGELYKKNIKKFNLDYKIYIDQISYVLNLIGVNVNTVPVLDLRRKYSHNIIGDRSYSYNKNIISKIGDVSINFFHQNRIGTVIKHIPGHGLAKVDSHHFTPIVNKNIHYLYKNDFKAFKSKKSLFAMTAHVVFKKIDPKNTVTHSKKMIKIIKNKIKFKNLIISDDLSMKSLKYSIAENTKKSFNAGCNLVLHCNGSLKEMIQVAENSPKLNSFVLKKTSEFYKNLS